MKVFSKHFVGTLMTRRIRPMPGSLKILALLFLASAYAMNDQGEVSETADISELGEPSYTDATEQDLQGQVTHEEKETEMPERGCVPPMKQPGAKERDLEAQFDDKLEAQIDRRGAGANTCTCANWNQKWEKALKETPTGTIEERAALEKEKAVCRSRTRCACWLFAITGGLYFNKEAIPKLVENMIPGGLSGPTKDFVYASNFNFILFMGVLAILSPVCPALQNVASALQVLYFSFAIVSGLAGAGAAVGGFKGCSNCHTTCFEGQCNSDGCDKCCANAFDCKDPACSPFIKVICCPCKTVCCYPCEGASCLLDQMPDCGVLENVKKCFRDSNWINEAQRLFCNVITSIGSCTRDKLCGENFECVEKVFSCSKDGLPQSNWKCSCPDGKLEGCGRCCGATWSLCGCFGLSSSCKSECTNCCVKECCQHCCVLKCKPNCLENPCKRHLVKAFLLECLKCPGNPGNQVDVVD